MRTSNAFGTLVGIMLAIALGACTRVIPSNSPGEHNAWTLPGTVRIGVPAEPDNINPLLGNSAATDDIDALLFAPLFRYDPDGNFIPELASEVPTRANGGISPDGTRIVLHLRRNVLWSDGVPLTGRDLLFTYSAVMNPANSVKTRSGWDEIASMRLRDPATVVVTLKRPDVTVLGLFANGGSAYPPLPAHLLKKLPSLDHAAFNEQPLSSGPWVLRSWQRGASLSFVPNPRYWRGPPKAREILWKVIPDDQTMFAALSAHEIDVDPNVSEDQIDRASALPGITVARRLLANRRRITINTAHPPLDDVRIRRALAQGVNWHRLLQTVYHERNVPAVSDIVPSSWAAPKIPPYAYDPAQARRLLDAAGFRVGRDGIRVRDGVPLHLTISATPLAPNVRSEVQIQQDLRTIGIVLTIKNYPASVLFSENGPLLGGHYDLETSIDTNAPDPDNRDTLSATAVPPYGGNTSFLRDRELTVLANAAVRSFDHATRAKLYQREEARAHALVPMIPLYWEVGTAAYNRDLRNYRPATYVTNNWNSWEWEN
ncbi:MAG TPA: peptide ABC transporter substrate-binding protein [Candidatus Baltobacteraceae bacterium]|jgi:peptide/nickel transport system substrate-binding protein|nr:peptide ABC transporter substrate-binding protein [Candidatus Baltobacteraceae bacterium]